jgi:hypothetical protein
VLKLLVGLVAGRRVTDVDLTVDVLVVVTGLCDDDTGSDVVSFLSSPADTTENVVVNASSS